MTGTLANLVRRIRLQHRSDTGSDQTEGSAVGEVEFRIPNLVCEGCAEKIDGVLRPMAGVREIRANVPQKRIHVRYEPTKVQPEQLKDAVNQAGFQAVDA